MWSNEIIVSAEMREAGASVIEELRDVISASGLAEEVYKAMASVSNDGWILVCAVPDELELVSVNNIKMSGDRMIVQTEDGRTTIVPIKSHKE